VQDGSVLQLNLHGQIYDEIMHSKSKLSLPQFHDNLLKTAYAPRISVSYLHINALKCGWAKLDEIRRQILNFKKSGKIVVALCQQLK